MYAISLDWYPPGIVFQPHAHAFSSASIILVGGLEERVGSRTEQGGPGTLIRKAAGTIHSNRFANVPALLLSVSVDRAELPDASAWAWSANRETAVLGWRAAVSLRDRTSWGSERIEELVALMLSPRTARRRPTSQSRLLARRVRDLIRSSAPASISIDAMARDAEVHPAHLVRVFREQFGCTPAVYARIVRLERAVSLLVGQPAMRVSEVAYAAGFSDESHLCRVLSRAFGIRPTAVRQFSTSAHAAFSRMFKSSN